MKQWYEELFENYGKSYDKEGYTQGTAGECDFIEAELRYDRSLAILDIGCGTGRHSIELTKRGYRVTGIDLSDSQLERAREKAKAEGLAIDFRKHDARALPFEGAFDAAIMLCEGGFSLMETDEMNYEILKNAAKALKPHGKLIFTTLNGLFPLHHSMDQFYTDASVEDGGVLSCISFDLMTFRNHSVLRVADDSGAEKELACNERYYVPPEITWLLKTLGFKKTDIMGARLGAFSREHKLSAEDFEMLIVAEK